MKTPKSAIGVLAVLLSFVVAPFAAGQRRTPYGVGLDDPRDLVVTDEEVGVGFS